MSAWSAPPSSTGRTRATPAAGSCSASRTPTPRATPRRATRSSSTRSSGSASTGTRASRVGGPDGPYRQSERGDIYQNVVARLLESGALYESFVTAEEMEARNVAAGRDPRQGYDNHERDLTAEARARIPGPRGVSPRCGSGSRDADVTIHDLIRGEITFPAGSFTDFVVVRPNGAPLYTFVNPSTTRSWASRTCSEARTSSPRRRGRSRCTSRSSTPASRSGAAVRPHGRSCTARARASLEARTPSRASSRTATADSSPRGCSTTSHCSAGRSARTATCSRSRSSSRRSTSAT